MSRIGKKPLDIPAGVSFTRSGTDLTVKGPKGEVAFHCSPDVELEHEGAAVTVKRRSNSKAAKAAQGTVRRILENCVRGVVEPYKRSLEVVGVGYQVRVAGRQLGLKVGYANEILLDIPEGVSVNLPSATKIEVVGADKQSVGAFCARIRKVRPPEPYNGKGIRYDGERIQRKAGKSFSSAG